MSYICSQEVKISGLAESLENFYDQIKDLVLLNQDLYQTVFNSEVIIDDWGSDWTIFHSKIYEYGDFSMNIVCESEIEPSFSFWQKVSKDFDLVVEISYFDLDSDLHCRIIFDYGLVIIDEKITNLEYLYINDRDSFWIECSNGDWSSVDEILSKLNTIRHYLEDDEVQKIQYVFENK